MISSGLFELFGNQLILWYVFVFCRQSWLKRNGCLECKIEQQAKNVGFTLSEV